MRRLQCNGAANINAHHWVAALFARPVAIVSVTIVETLFFYNVPTRLNL